MPSSSTPRSPTSPRRSCICRPPMTCVVDAVRACARHCGSPLRAAAVAASNDGDGLVCADRAPAWPRIDEDCALLLPSQLRATIVAARKLARMQRESYARPRSPSRRWPVLSLISSALIVALKPDSCSCVVLASARLSSWLKRTRLAVSCSRLRRRRRRRARPSRGYAPLACRTRGPSRRGPRGGSLRCGFGRCFLMHATAAPRFRTAGSWNRLSQRNPEAATCACQFMSVSQCGVGGARARPLAHTETAGCAGPPSVSAKARMLQDSNLCGKIPVDF